VVTVTTRLDPLAFTRHGTGGVKYFAKPSQDKASTMSFGFSAGDIAMAIKFTISVTNALNDTRGAAPEYQQAIEHWKQLLVAYQHLQHLHTRCLDPALLDEIRSLAALAEEPIHDYIKKIHADFGTAMPTNAGESRLQVSKIFKKAKWALHSSAKDEKLRSQMSARLQTVQIKFEQLNMYIPSNCRLYFGANAN
jgi:hypothetical protein